MPGISVLKAMLSIEPAEKLDWALHIFRICSAVGINQDYKEIIKRVMFCRS